MPSANPQILPATWDSGALLTKAQRYVEEMQQHSHDDWRFAFWSSLALELIARSALANISPTLLADHSSWSNLYYALGHSPKAQKFAPKSIAITEVLSRLGEVLSDFDEELRNFCITHTGSRNGELHSGDTPFDGLKSSSWLPSFYRSCDVLLISLSSTLEEMFGDDAAQAARKQMIAAKDLAAKAVMGTIKAHNTV
jgi:hypothetical protein